MKNPGLWTEDGLAEDAGREKAVPHLPPAPADGRGRATQAPGLSLSQTSPETGKGAGSAASALNQSIVRAGKGRELGTFKPVRVHLMPLGGTLGYTVETFELTPFSFVVYEDAEDGERIDFRPGSTLVDGKLHIVDEHDLDSTIPFIGKVTEEVEIHSERHGHCLGYLIRIAQISIDDQDALTRSLRAMETV